jgi:hypothetical protein
MVGDGRVEVNVSAFCMATLAEKLVTSTALQVDRLR